MRVSFRFPTTNWTYECLNGSTIAPSPQAPGKTISEAYRIKLNFVQLVALVHVHFVGWKERLSPDNETPCYGRTAEKALI